MPCGRREAGKVDPFTAMRREMDRLMASMNWGTGVALLGLGDGVGGIRVDMEETLETQATKIEIKSAD